MNAAVKCCPCCGGPVAVDPLAEARAALSPHQRAVLDVVARRPGLSARSIADVIYADDPDGGPLTAAMCVPQHVHHANRRLSRFGLRISGETQHGYRLHRISAPGHADRVSA